MGIVRQALQWVDKAIAPKATQDDVLARFTLSQQEHVAVIKRLDATESFTLELRNRIIDLARETEKILDSNLKLRDELNAVKALLRIGGQKPPNPPGQKFDGSEAWKR